MSDMEFKYVTQNQCEDRRNEFDRRLQQETRDISKLFGETRALNENIKNLVSQNKWFMGIVSSILGGLMIWLITK